MAQCTTSVHNIYKSHHWSLKIVFLIFVGLKPYCTSLYIKEKPKYTHKCYWCSKCKECIYIQGHPHCVFEPECLLSYRTNMKLSVLEEWVHESPLIQSNLKLKHAIKRQVLGHKKMVRPPRLGAWASHMLRSN